MQGCIQEKVINRMRQYGFRAGLAQILRAMVRMVYQVDRDIIYAMPDFSGHALNDSCMKSMTNERINQAGLSGKLNNAEVQLLRGFLTDGCRGLCAEIDGNLAGYSWVQFTGKYRFGRTGRMIIPPRYAIIKNVLVLPEYRAHKLGQKLVAACLSLISDRHTPVILTMPENRYSIRNCERCGFQRVLHVKRWRWFRRSWHMDIDRLADGTTADELEQALIEGHNEERAAAEPKGGS